MEKLVDVTNKIEEEYMVKRVWWNIVEQKWEMNTK